jgi:diguanylate cyclase (GGDEF)-like protein
LEFTDITTVQKRLKDRKSIIGEFVDVNSGWIKAQYIVSGYNKDGYPTLIIFTVQNIENEKLREDNLIRIAMTDELTLLGNRRGYDEEIRTYMEEILPYDFVIYSVDVNGLKTVNDTRGHSAGDKLIMSAARCIRETVGEKGKVFRTGGDEFIAIVSTKEPAILFKTIKDKASSTEVFPEYTLSISVGYAAVADFPNLDLKGLVKKADNMMYEDKETYYKKMGIDRRRK